MKHIYYILISIVFSFTAYAQEFQFDIRGKNVNDIIKYEKKAGSILIKNSSTYYSGKGNAQPITYERKEKDIPNLRVIYTFQEKDSLTKSILYEWDIRNFEDRENNVQSKNFEKALIEKYNNLETKIIKKFGSGKIEGDLGDLSKSETEDGLNKRAIWTLNDSTVISMYITISNYYKKTGAVTRNPTHRIRLSIDLPAQIPTIPKLSDLRLKLLDNKSLEFIDALAKKDITALKANLSPELLPQATDEAILNLSEFLAGDEKMELYYHGIQSNLADEFYVMLQYKFSSDTSTPPDKMLKLTFNDQDKIIGVMPMNRN